MRAARAGEEDRLPGMGREHHGPGVGVSTPGRREPVGAAAEVADGLLEYIERSSAAIVIADGRTLEIRYANPAFEQLSHPDDGTLASLGLAHALPKPAMEAIEHLLDTLPAEEGRCEVEIASGRGSPGIADWRIALSRVPSAGNRPGDVVVEIRDISREQMEQRELATLLHEIREVNGRLLNASLREAELATRAEAASEAKSTFLATMSHELRTPLTAIIGYEELLSDGIFGPVTELQRGHLGRLKRSATHLLGLIDQILTLARVEAGREPLQCTRVSMTELLEGTTTMIEPLARSKGLDFTTQLTDDALVMETDEMKVRQILVNLLGNSVKFTDRGTVSLRVQAAGEMVVFEIRDTGIGIGPDDLERVFGAFWQVEQRPTRKVGGSGLGLSVSRRLARLLGGDIRAESTVGAGSVFTVILPRETTGERAE